MGFFPYMGEILWVFLTIMEVFPIPPLSRGRAGGGWGIYVAVVCRIAALFNKDLKRVESLFHSYERSLRSQSAYSIVEDQR